MGNKYIPCISDFTPFHRLDPSEKQCMFFTQPRKGFPSRRCESRCEPSDSREAISLFKTIMASPPDAITPDQIRRYILCNCCFQRKHQHNIEDMKLLEPLCRRWLAEIWRTSAATTTPNGTTAIPSYAADLSCPRDDVSTSNKPHQLDLEPVSQEPFHQAGDPTGLITREDGSRYNLRQRDASTLVHAESNPIKSTLQERLSTFHPHIREPGPSDSVVRKILSPLGSRDRKTGMLYMFFRDLSLGHVKIGYTAVSVQKRPDPVQDRLDHYSGCGYEPVLRFKIGSVPLAQRVELLVHYELMKEWRGEAYCEAHGMRHYEWFEVSRERAIQVLSGWVDFMKRAQPYNDDGLLKCEWKEIVKNMEDKGELVTAARLLHHYERSLTDDTTPLVKSNDVESCSYAPKTDVQEEAPAMKLEPLSEAIQPAEGRLITPENEEQDESHPQTKPIPEPATVWRLKSPTDLKPQLGGLPSNCVEPSPMLKVRKSEDGRLSMESSKVRQLRKVRHFVQMIEEKNVSPLLLRGKTQLSPGLAGQQLDTTIINNLTSRRTKEPSGTSADLREVEGTRDEYGMPKVSEEAALKTFEEVSNKFSMGDVSSSGANDFSGVEIPRSQVTLSVEVVAQA